MTDPLRIANCSGFYGDRLSAAQEMVEGGPIDVLTGDWLAELTMLILWKGYQRDHSRGWAHTFLTQMEEVLGTCVDRGIKVVTNAGGLNPAGLADQVRALSRPAGSRACRSPMSRATTCCLGSPSSQTAGHPLAHLDTGQPLAEAAGEVVSANAYLGAWPIVEALAGGADVVICPRITDASLVVGPAAWHHGWSPTDWDRLAGAVVAGHVIECGPQATGGNYAFFTEVEGMDHPGFPIAEVAADGSSVITKHPGTGGEVSVGTVTAQLLYEIAGPRVPQHRCGGPVRHHRRRPGGPRPGPDLRHPGPAGPGRREGVLQPAGRLAQLDDLRPHRTRHRREGGTHPALAGGSPRRRGTRFAEFDARLDPLRQGRRAGQRRGHRPAADHREGRRPRQGGPELLGCGHRAGPGRLPRAPPDRPAGLGHRVRRLLAGAGAGRPGRPGGPRRRPAGGGPPHCPPSRGRGPTWRPASTTGRVPSRLPRRAARAGSAPERHDLDAPRPSAPSSGPARGTRAATPTSGCGRGRKRRGRGSTPYLTLDAFRALLPEADGLEIRRYPFPNLRPLNFVVVGLLGEGVACSTRPDPQAKGLGEYLRSRAVDIPADFRVS